MLFAGQTRVCQRTIMLVAGAHWRLLANAIVPSMCDGDAASCQITLTTSKYPTTSETRCYTSWWNIYFKIITVLKNWVKQSAIQVSAAEELLKKTLDICIILFTDEKIFEQAILKFPQNDQLHAFVPAENKHCETFVEKHLRTWLSKV